MLGQIRQECIHPVISRCVDHRPAFTAHCHKTGHPEAVEVKGQRVGSEIEGLGDLSRSHAFRPSPNKQPEHVEPVVLGEGR